MVIQEQHLGTIERLVDEREKESKSEQERLRVKMNQEISSWEVQKEAEKCQLDQFRNLHEQKEREVCERRRKKELEMSVETSRLEQKQRVLEVQAACLRLGEDEDLIMQEQVLMNRRKEWEDEKEHETKLWERQQKELKRQVKRLESFAADVEAQANMNTKQQQALDERFEQVSLGEKSASVQNNVARSQDES
ncbi:hypothetical protein AC1031_007873 [Aphanomyces cochlioides]|nr:hypothetical protein AC1031_007873 [Aphanomyces cochlioides]